MRRTLKNVDVIKLAKAKTLQDSINLAVSDNPTKYMKANFDGSDEDIDVDIDETVVMISVSDKVLFNSGSYEEVLRLIMF